MLQKILKNLPNESGVYKFYDENNNLLYVGKAKNLKNRVSSYFKFTPSLQPSPKLSPRIYKMVSEAYNLEYIISPSEYDALILENSLIKELKPKYNILLRDDKTYPYIMIDYNQEFPRFEITRKINPKANIKYFGPFATGANEILKAIYLCYKLVQKKSCIKSKKACLFYQLDKCFAPCEDKISKEEYLKILNEALESFTDRKKLIKKLEEKMIQASKNLNFEEAAELRDIQKAIKNTLHIIHVDLAKIESFDLIAVEIVGNIASIVQLFIRDGKIVSTLQKSIKNSNGYEINEIYKRALIQFYNESNKLISKEILVADDFNEKEEIENLFKIKYNKTVSIKTPKRGEKYNLAKIAKKNAKEAILQYINKSSTNLLEDIKDLFDLSSIPYRIEVFDNSHISGSSAVGSMVVYEDKFIKSDYRIFNLSHKDEYSQMRELLTRRIKDCFNNPLPDLWVLDGGATLLKLADTILKEHNQNIDLLAIAKEKIDAKANRSKGRANDIIYNKSFEFKLPPNDKRLQFIQKLRDEAHRFAIKSHRNKKLSNDLSLNLLQIEGIGNATVKKLISYFGSFDLIYQAKKEELINVIGEKNGKKIFHFINK
ncbi:excinuclease ABC subunit UvrC [Sulfurospirillum sp. 1307]|jgi:excinuclease ABC subunit C